MLGSCSSRADISSSLHRKEVVFVPIQCRSGDTNTKSVPCGSSAPLKSNLSPRGGRAHVNACGEVMVRSPSRNRYQVSPTFQGRIHKEIVTDDKKTIAGRRFI